MKFMKQRRGRSDEDDDPLSGVANLFDVAMIFAVGLLVMMMMYVNLPELLTSQDVTIVKNPGQDDMQVIIKNETEIEVLNMTDETVTTMGKLVASLYETEGGATVYV
ncbi:MAG: DUF2149 domain-containing protein, partial [Euryarchaeota archaeon]|nr:DUF2149 domain-containing protein [Euryarchaeota archaeon]